MPSAAYDANNVFARIIRGEIKASVRYEDDAAIAIDDASPAAPVHALVLPKGPYTDFGDFIARAGTEEAARFFATVRRVAEDVLNLREGGYRLIANTGTDASQTVAHFHVHILGGRKLGGLLPTDRLAR
jgi:histidine triad (HIT) family protein